MEAETHITAYRHGEPHRCRVVISEVLLYREQRYRVSLTTPTGAIWEWTDKTICAALMEIRRQVEPLGWRLAINAARFDAVPCQLFNDVFVWLPDDFGNWYKVPALGEASLSELADVEQQQSYFDILIRAQMYPLSELSADREQWWELVPA